MKKHIILIIAILVFSKITIAQCDNNVSTNPSNPTNNALPDLPGTVPYQLDTRYLNGFDWVNGNANMPNQEYSLLNMMYNPTQPYTFMSNIQNANLTGYYTYLNKTLGNDLMRLENGWELMLINLGRYPNNAPHASTDFNSIPYLVFYNKFTGILRVFVQFGYNETPPNSINGVRIDLQYITQDLPTNVSGILRLSGGKDKALNLPTTSEIITAVAPKEGQANFWMSGDFQLTYDPCVCVHITQLNLTFNFFSETDFKLHGRGIQIEEPLVNNTTILDKDFLSNVDADLSDTQGGLVIYENINKLIEDYIAKMEAYDQKLAAVNQHNEQVKENLIIAKAVKKIITVGISAAVGTPPILNLQGKLSNLFFDDTTKKSKDKVKKIFDKFSDLAGKQFDTYISKNFVTQNAPQKPIAPTANFSEMYFSGTLTNTSPALGPTFITPGSFKNNVSIDPITNQPINNILDLPYQDVYEYPVYNQPVGVFALLEEPKFEKSEYSKIELPNNNFIYTTNKIQFQLKSPLKYTFNSALEIQKKSVEAMLVIKTTTSANFLPSPSFEIIDKSINLFSNEINTYKNDTLFMFNQPLFQNGFFLKSSDTINYNSGFIPNLKGLLKNEIDIKPGSYLETEKPYCKTLTEDEKKIFDEIFPYKQIFQKKEDPMFYAATLAHELNTPVCPYCNREYITSVITSKEKKIIGPTFDHFLSQKDYPFLKLSFFNLIPSCTTCNSRLKNQTEFDFEHFLYPYCDSYEGLANFELRLGKSILKTPIDDSAIIEENKLIIKIKNQSRSIKLFGPNPKKIKKKGNLNVFQTQKIYNDSHKDVAFDILEKFRRIPKSQIDSIIKTLEGQSKTQQEIYRFYYGNYLNEDDFNKRPLARMTRDIARQLESIYQIGIKI